MSENNDAPRLPETPKEKEERRSNEKLVREIKQLLR